VRSDRVPRSITSWRPLAGAGTFAGAPEARQVDVERQACQVEATGEVLD
jgi:hypothetical protein